MHYFGSCTVLIIVLVVVAARSAPSTKSPVTYRLCPEEHQQLRRRQDEASTELVDEDEDTVEDRESVCEEGIDMIARHRHLSELNPSLFLYYCPHYDERLALVQENNNTLCEERKQEFKRNGHDDSIDGDDDKRRALRRRELKKRFALRFIRKRMS